MQERASTMFCSVCNSSRDGSPEAACRVLAGSIADRVGDSPQTKAHLGEKQRLQTEGKGAPWKFAKADLWRPASHCEKNKQAAGLIYLSGKGSLFNKAFLLLVFYIEFWRQALNRKISMSGGEIEDGAQCQLSDGSIHFL